MKKQLLFTLTLFWCSLLSFGQTFTDNGINYSATNLTTVEVTATINYVGVANIPSNVIYNGNSYSVTNIEASAFANSPTLTSVIIPNTVTSIPSAVFQNCSNLTSVSLPNSITSINGSAFYNCSSLTSITIPNSVTNFLGSSIFYGCSSLSSIVIPNSVTTIPNGMFYGCSNLTSVILPISITSIGSFAFESCTSLTSFIFPNSISSINGASFRNCIALASISIPNSINNIGFSAFSGCTYLNSVVINRVIPLSIDSSVFSNIPFGSATLYVPAGTLATYDAAPVWTNFNTIAEICATPSVFNTTSSPGDCPWTGDFVYLSGSEIGINYQLKRDGVNVGGLIAGNGSQLSFGQQSVSGTYTVEAINNIGTCNILVNMNGSGVIFSYPASVGGNITGSATICANTTSGILTLENNVGTIEYWESSISPFTAWTTVAGNVATYSPGVLSETTQFRAYSRSGYCNANADSAIATITVNASSDNITTVSNCGSYTWANNGQTYTDSGIYTGTTTNCVTEKLDLTITTTPLPTRNMSINGTLCEPSTYSDLASKFDNSSTIKIYATATSTTPLNLQDIMAPIGTNVNYYITQNLNGCESGRLTYSAFVNTLPTPTAFDQVFCGTGYDVGDLVATLSPNAYNLKWYDVPTGGTQLNTNTVVYLVSGNYYVSQSKYPCGESDRKMITVTVSLPTDNVTTISACDSYTWNGTTYTESGIYTGTTTNCVTEKLNLTISPSSINVTTATACGVYMWNGTLYNESGIYTGTTTNCVTEKLDLTIVPNTYNFISITACDSYVFNGETLTQSATYFGTADANCVTDVLTLTISPSYFNNTTVYACDSYTWANNAQTYTQSGTYYGTTTGCGTEKLNLTITPTPIADTPFNVTACQVYILPALSPGNKYYSESNGQGIEYVVGANDGITQTSEIYVLARSPFYPFCQSQNSFTVTIIPNSGTNTIENACGSYIWGVNGETYTTSGIYEYISGCNTSYLNLTIIPLADNSVTQQNDTLTATENGATYQWFTCETNGSFTPINMATNQSYLVTAIGSYAVEVTKNGCPTTSNCINITALGTNSFDTTNFTYYPNPVIDNLNITYNKNISNVQIFDLTGRMVKSVQPNTQMFDVNLTELSSAMYLVKLTDENNTQTEIKIFKK
jgi:hypothetical protein